MDSEEEEVASSSKRARTDSGNGEKKREGEESKKETTDNGMTARFMMFGATLNPTSGQAKDLNTVLQVNAQARLRDVFRKKRD